MKMRPVQDQELLAGVCLSWSMENNSWDCFDAGIHGSVALGTRAANHGGLCNLMPEAPFRAPDRLLG